MSISHLPSRESKPHLRLVAASGAGEPVGGAEPAEESLEFSAVFRRYGRYVANIGAKILGAHDDLDDLVQEVFLEAYRGLAEVREPRAVRGWLARICVRCATRRLKRRRLRAWFSLDKIDDARLPAHAGTSPERSAEARAAYQILETMSAEERAVWVLRHLEDESLDDIAIICACSKSTVQRRLRTAQARFAKESGT
jgi:RNA polymerase sigma-70 factor (ECF subfamily)